MVHAPFTCSVAAPIPFQPLKFTLLLPTSTPLPCPFCFLHLEHLFLHLPLNQCLPVIHLSRVSSRESVLDLWTRSEPSTMCALHLLSFFPIQRVGFCSVLFVNYWPSLPLANKRAEKDRDCTWPDHPCMPSTHYRACQSVGIS